MDLGLARGSRWRVAGIGGKVAQSPNRANYSGWGGFTAPLFKL